MTPTFTPTNTRTSTPTFTPGPPRIDPGLMPGDNNVTGTGFPNCMNGIQICLVGNGSTPNVPPCTGPDTILGTGSTDAMGMFNIMINPPLVIGQCIYANDTCNGLVGPVACVFTSAPAPALSPRYTAVAMAVLMLVALVGFARLRRSAEN